MPKEAAKKYLVINQAQWTFKVAINNVSFAEALLHQKYQNCMVGQQFNGLQGLESESDIPISIFRVREMVFWECLFLPLSLT